MLGNPFPALWTPSRQAVGVTLMDSRILPTVRRAVCYLLRSWTMACGGPDQTGSAMTYLTGQSNPSLYPTPLLKREIKSVTTFLLKSEATIPSSSPFVSLNPFLDGDGMLRVGGREANSK